MIKLFDLIKEEMIPGGLAKGKSVQDIARKHKVSVSTIQHQIEKGIRVEMEHTTSEKAAREIAMDHVFESPTYYNDLKQIEDE